MVPENSKHLVQTNLALTHIVKGYKFEFDDEGRSTEAKVIFCWVWW